ncbi:VWA domain-containing protein [Leptotrichia sp. oral taxon 212]|uniref:VWA domain-containing protein n=1 Tax=Leptotrichia sp. oral taxon 212 TaxID=712357 RepID=UPI0006A9D56C|nr:VWA domain-containing protein [Leptotrichia sp. oral taxon 212]ALA94911.1 hypothetical protein AMK43_01630 [Leptotrichia sp. oral taxon 212]
MKIEISLTSHLVKPIKYYINSIYRKKVAPRKGSIIYSDFGPAGVYIGDNRIVSINENGLSAEDDEVKCMTMEEFIKNSHFPESLYVSSNEEGAIENIKVAEAAEKYIGEKNKYRLVFKDSCSLVKKCLDYSEENFFGNSEDITESNLSETGLLKQKAKNKTGAVKWFLQDLNYYKSASDELELEKAFSINEVSGNEKEEFRKLNIGKIIKNYEEVPLNDDIMKHLNKEYREMLDFFREINSEKIPDPVMKIVIKIIRVLEEIILGYEHNENSIKGLGGDFTFKQLKEMGDEFRHLVQEMNRNRHIRDVLKRLGKGSTSVEKKDESKVAKIKKDELFGINKSGNISRILPSELLNLEDENLKYLFYAKYLENSLLTYEIKGKDEIEKNETEEKISNKGPIVVCLDTSGSMKGTPLLRAKALVLSITKILREENRELYVILFGAKGQFQEISLEGEEDICRAIKFLKKSYEGGTDFETPLRRGIEIISEKENYRKADILMVTDGSCRISYQFKRVLKEEKERLDFKIYTVICEADRVEKDFSDGVIVI